MGCEMKVHISCSIIEKKYLENSLICRFFVHVLLGQKISHFNLLSQLLFKKNPLTMKIKKIILCSSHTTFSCFAFEFNKYFFLFLHYNVRLFMYCLHFKEEIFIHCRRLKVTVAKHLHKTFFYFCPFTFYSRETQCVAI